MAKQIRYSEEFKRQAVSTYLQGELSCNQIAQSIHVHPNTLSTWIKQYKNCQLLSTPLPSTNKYIDTQSPTNLEIDAIFSALSEIEMQARVLKKLIMNHQ